MDAVGPVMTGAARWPASTGVAPADERSFREILQQSLERVERLQAEADGTIDKLRLGEATEVEALMAIQRARMAVDAMTEIRNRIVAAFTEIQQMRV
ncbi:MAG: flagellar hook-basal body complex protein FliE [Planctomycetes bacterium]|nr:flagellar hook-basal body complex protein FliE [Planctomycetota bacterium]